ncbi:MAG: hypothetical protein KDD66_15680, partial [Bdellovibrionales bacterium]|nr:hypothetical protein [Bdellovibrionales bacterium]
SPSQALWGEPGDIPLSADFDGDGTSDLVIYRPSDGTWWIVRSRDGFLHKQWGLPGDMPVPEDFDGDGKDDFAVWRPSSGFWAVSFSSKNYSTAQDDILWVQWGLTGDYPMVGDYDGDGSSDLAVWRDWNGRWYLCTSVSSFNCHAQGSEQQFGLPGDVPLKGDFDGDSILDFAVWRPSNGTWYWKRSSDAVVNNKQWGLWFDYPLSAGIKNQMQLLE